MGVVDDDCEQWQVRVDFIRQQVGHLTLHPTVFNGIRRCQKWISTRWWPLRRKDVAYLSWSCSYSYPTFCKPVSHIPSPSTPCFDLDCSQHSFFAPVILSIFLLWEIIAVQLLFHWTHTSSETIFGVCSLFLSLWDVMSIFKCCSTSIALQSIQTSFLWSLLPSFNSLQGHTMTFPYPKTNKTSTFTSERIPGLLIPSTCVFHKKCAKNEVGMKFAR